MGKAKQLERAPTSAAQAPTQRSSGDPAPLAPGGQDRLLGARGKPVEAPAKSVNPRAAMAGVPGGLAHGEAVEAVDPALADAEDYCPRQPLVHGVGGKSAELFRARAFEKFAEAFDVGSCLRSAQGLAGHERRERGHDEARQTEPDGEGHGRSREAAWAARQHKGSQSDQAEARDEPEGPHPFWRRREQAVSDEASVDLVSKRGKDGVIVAPDLGEPALGQTPVAAEEPAENRALERPEVGIIGEGPEPVHDPVRLAEGGLDLLDANIAAHREIDEGGHDVARRGPLRHEGAPRRGHHALGRLILGLDRRRPAQPAPPVPMATFTRIATVGAPDEKEATQGQERQAERPVVAEEPPRLLYHPGTPDRAGRPAHGYGQSLAR